MENKIPPELEQCARWQAGVISRAQATGTGLPRNTIVSRVQRGRWQAVHPGIYATFTGPVSRDARLWAAILHAGPEARLSHETAAELLRLTSQRTECIHVTIP